MDIKIPIDTVTWDEKIAQFVKKAEVFTARNYFLPNYEFIVIIHHVISCASDHIIGWWSSGTHISILAAVLVLSLY